jgi:hypothetical protein
MLFRNDNQLLSREILQRKRPQADCAWLEAQPPWDLSSGHFRPLTSQGCGAPDAGQLRYRGERITSHVLVTFPRWETSTGNTKLPTGWYNCCVINTNGFELKGWRNFSSAQSNIQYTSTIPAEGESPCTSVSNNRKRLRCDAALTSYIASNVSDETHSSIIRISSTPNIKYCIFR